MWTQFWDMHSGGGTKVVRLPDGSFIDGNRFTDQGQPIDRIYIEAPEDEAKVIFYNRFGHNPERVSCTCCGEDYSISSGENLAQVTGYHRNCRALETPRDKNGLFKPPDDQWFKEHYYLEPEDETEAVRRGYAVDTRFSRGGYQTLEDYMNNNDVLFIPAMHIKPEERKGEVPEQGYVWMD